MKNEKIKSVLEQMDNAIIGQSEISKFLITAMLAGGHVLLEGVPGVGKTTLANVFAKSVDCRFARIQFTPDTMPSDITGTSIYNFENHCFEYIPGVLMNQIILADEINRTSPKTQAALLEAMEEGKITVDGKNYLLPQPFIVLATQNPVMQRGTYYLPESQLDRFMMKLNVSYPQEKDELQIVKNMLSGKMTEKIDCIISSEEIIKLKEQVNEITVNENLITYAMECVRATREHEKVLLGASTRALLVWVKASKAYAFVEGREYVNPDDLKKLAPVVLAHRIIMTQSSSEQESVAVISEILRKVRVPVGK